LTVVNYSQVSGENAGDKNPLFSSFERPNFAIYKRRGDFIPGLFTTKFSYVSLWRLTTFDFEVTL